MTLLILSAICCCPESVAAQPRPRDFVDVYNNVKVHTEVVYEWPFFVKTSRATSAELGDELEARLAAYLETKVKYWLFEPSTKASADVRLVLHVKEEKRNTVRAKLTFLSGLDSKVILDWVLWEPAEVVRRVADPSRLRNDTAEQIERQIEAQGLGKIEDLIRERVPVAIGGAWLGRSAETLVLGLPWPAFQELASSRFAVWCRAGASDRKIEAVGSRKMALYSTAGGSRKDFNGLEASVKVGSESEVEPLAELRRFLPNLIYLEQFVFDQALTYQVVGAPR